MEEGLVHIYCGEGKGKTTAAVGLCTRALGCGKKVVFAQFLKGIKTSETDALQKLGAHILSGESSDKFVFQMTDEEKQQCRKIETQNLKNAMAIDCDVLVLDEICAAYSLGMIDEEIAKTAILNKPIHKEVVLTGRDPAEFMVKAANYITEMKCIKHPYNEGIAARKGIEY